MTAAETKSLQDKASLLRLTDCLASVETERDAAKKTAWRRLEERDKAQATIECAARRSVLTRIPLQQRTADGHSEPMAGQ